MFPILNPAPTSLPYHPSGSSQCTSPNLPISCIDPRLAIRFLYDIIHVLMPFSYIIPPPSPTESKRLFYKSVSLLLSRIHMSTCCVILFSSLNYHQHKSTHFISSYFSFSTFFGSSPSSSHAPQHFPLPPSILFLSLSVSLPFSSPPLFPIPPSFYCL